ncbi:MAG: MOSC domain-containing protein [Hyphomicrobiales bacterium]
MSTFGTVRYITRYPVKSMRGEALDEARITFTGIPGDRWFSFVQDGDHSAFPWLTARECSEMLQYQPAVRAIGVGRLEVDVTTPAGKVLDIASDELRQDIERRAGRPIHLHSDYRGNQDVAYVSLISTATIRALAEQGGVPDDHRRFRMNLVVEADVPPFGEAQLVGQVLSIGDVRLAVTEQDRRCQMITLDPERGESVPAVLKAAGTLNDACAGLYLSVLAPGKVRLGDEVVVEGA